MKRSTLISLTFLFLLSCTTKVQTSAPAAPGNTANTGSVNSVTASSSSDTLFKLDKFNVVPDAISGCGEYLTYDTSQFEKDNYIFLSNLSSVAIIRINGKDIYLKKDTAASQSVNRENYIAVYQGQGFKAVLTMKQTKAYDEGGFYSGTLQITGNGKDATFKVHGEAGC